MQMIPVIQIYFLNSESKTNHTTTDSSLLEDRCNECVYLKKKTAKEACSQHQEQPFEELYL